MKREDLEKLELNAEQINQIMVLHGKDIEKAKADLAALTTERDGLKKQLEEANTAIEGFKKLDVDAIKAAADEWKAKAEKAEADRVAEVSKLKFEHALDMALTGAKAKNAKAVKALLELDNLKLNEADGSIIGLDDQLKKIREDADYLFESSEVTPRVVAGGKSKSVIVDPVIQAARKAAGLTVEE
jgi:predicted  nucleic acid-binding Zn-ribbon protein